MSKCPHCSNDLQVDEVVFANVSRYQQTQFAATRCCGKGVYVGAVTSFRISPYFGDKTVDNWGNDVKPTDKSLMHH